MTNRGFRIGRYSHMQLSCKLLTLKLVYELTSVKTAVDHVHGLKSYPFMAYCSGPEDTQLDPQDMLGFLSSL
jgi:hypothetical protein